MSAQRSDRLPNEAILHRFVSRESAGEIAPFSPFAQVTTHEDPGHDTGQPVMGIGSQHLRPAKQMRRQIGRRHDDIFLTHRGKG